MTGTRRGLVLGAGGVLGAAWMTGALVAIQEVAGFDPGSAEILVGTSAGSVLAALLAAGVPNEALRSHQLGLPLPEERRVEWDHDRGTGGPLPVPPRRLRVGSPPLLRRASRREVPALAGFWALVPPGRGSQEPLRRLVAGAAGGSGWPACPALRVVAMDYATGRRVAFGSPDAPAASLVDAVAASCAIPGWYPPVVIDGRPYIDGGVASACSVDLTAGLELDEVYVLCPLASTSMDTPSAFATRLERRWRRRVTGRLLAEVARVEASGTRVRMLTPGPEDLAAMGANLMDMRRRLRVLETSLRTSAAALRSTDQRPAARAR